EDPLLGFVHLQMNFVPHPVVKTHNSHEDDSPLPGDESNNDSKWNSLYRRLAKSQTHLLIFTGSDRLITEYLEVMLMMHKGVSLKYALESGSMPSEKLFVHQPAVHLVLDERHQNARDNKPDDNLQNKHHTSKTAFMKTTAASARPSVIAWNTPSRFLILVRISKMKHVHCALID